MSSRERREPHATPARPPEPAALTLPAPAPSALDPAAVVSLQRTAGNAAVSSLIAGRSGGGSRVPRPAGPDHGGGDAAITAGLARAVMRAPAAAAPAGGGEVRVVERLPTIQEPGVKYVVAAPERRYTFEVTVEGKPTHFRNLTPAQAVERLRVIWRVVHSDLDDGRRENLKLQQRREEHRTAGFWSDLFGGTEVPDPTMWDEVGRGSLSEVMTVLNSTDAVLKERWAQGEAASDRNLPPELQSNPMMQAALAFDATEEKIKYATALLERATRELNERRQRMDDYVDASNRGAQRMVTGIKVTIVVLSAAAGGAGAEFAGAEAGLLSQAAYGAGTMGIVGAADEAATQLGEMRIGERDHFDVARLGKRAVRDVVTGFVGGVVGGRFSQVLKGRLGAWASGLSDEAIAASGLTREQLLTNGERLFAEWVAGSVASSPFTTTAGHLMDLALDGKLKVHTFGEFARSVLDDMMQSAALGGFLTYAGHAMGGGPGTGAKAGRTKPARGAGKPRRASTGHPKPPKPPVIHESPPGGFEPTTAEPPAEDYGPEPHVEDIVPTEPTPRRESRNLSDPGKPGKRKVHASVVEVERAVHEALKQVDEQAKAGPKGPREIDKQIAEIAKTDPAFADQVRRYYDAIGDPKFVEEQMVHLWEQARDHQRTPGEELEQLLGSGTEGINEFKNTPGLKPEAAIEEFRQTLVDPAPLVDLSSAGDHHGSHTHAFQQYLGDQLFGRGEGLKFRQKLATLKGPSKTQRSGQQDTYEKPFWSQLWDELFDASGNLHSPEKIGEILQDHLDFPRWDPSENAR